METFLGVTGISNFCVLPLGSGSPLLCICISIPAGLVVSSRLLSELLGSALSADITPVGRFIYSLMLRVWSKSDHLASVTLPLGDPWDCPCILAQITQVHVEGLLH